MKLKMKKVTSVFMSVVMVASLTLSYSGLKNETVKASDTVQYARGSMAATVDSSNAGLTAKLPTIANKGTYRFTTDNYDNNHSTLQTNDWATS